MSAPEVLKIKRTSGIAGQFSLTVTVQYEGEAPQQTTFIGSEYGHPTVMVINNHQVFVRDPERHGSKLSPEWVRRFFAER